MKHHPIAARLLLLGAASILPASGLAQVKDHREIKYPKLPQFEIPRPETFTLDNGLTVFLMPDPELPLISVSAQIRTGSNHMPAEKEGLGAVFGQVQREGGTATRTGDEIDDFLESRAAFVETGMGGDAASASMDCLEADFDAVFDVFIDILRHPAFAEDKIELAKVRLNTSISRRNDNVDAIVGREFRRLVYGPDSPLARLTEYATVAAITREDLLAWHARAYHPNNVLLGVSGDFDPQQMRQKITTALGGWPRGPAFAEPEVSYRREPAPGLYFIEKQDVTQAYIRLGHLGIQRDNPDYYAVVVLNEVLGGGFSGRLAQNIRSDKGLAYSVFGGIGATFLRPGVFQAGLSTKSSTMAQALAALRAEIAGMIANPATASELEQAKESILNSFVFNYDSRAQILGQQMTFAYFGLPPDYLEQYRANIEKVTGEQVAEVARKYLHLDSAALLVVGKAEEFDQPLSALGQVQEIDISIPPPAAPRPAPAQTAASLDAGAQVVERMARKLSNGVEAAVESVRARQTVVASMGGSPMTLGQEASFVLPDKLRVTTLTPMGEMVTVINGGRGVMLAGGRSAPLPGEMAQRGLEELGRDLLILADSVDDPDFRAVAAGPGEVDGSACDLVAVTHRSTESRLCIDAEGTVLEQSYQGTHPFQGTPGTVTLRYSDYTELGGRLLPRSSVMTFDGQEVATTTLESLEVNADLDPSLFELPPAE